MDRDARTASPTELNSPGSDESNAYLPKRIVAEGWFPGLGKTKYLIEWVKYGTWEPTENLARTTLLEDWANLKTRLGQRRFRIHIARNIRKWFEANEAKGIFYSGDDVPTMPSRNDYHQDNTSTNSNSLFVNDHDPRPSSPPTASNNLPTKAPGARKHPFAQTTQGRASSSSSSNSDSDYESEDSRLEEIAGGEKNSKNPVEAKALATQSRKVFELGSSILSSNRSRTVPTLPKSIPGAANVTVSKLGNQGQQSTSSNGSSDTKLHHVSSGASNAIGHRNSYTTNVAANPPTNSNPRQHPKISSRPEVKPIGPASKTTNPIKFTNEPVVAQRKAWDTERLYGKLKYRGIAEKRSREEGKPDIETLDFVGSQPTSLGKRKSRDTEDNPYGRREAGHRRVQEVDTHEIVRKDTVEQAIPLEKWEADKVPLICPQWRLSNNCQYSAEMCPFLHRHKDAEGRPLTIANSNGKIPQKYRKPPLTCPFWLQGATGCRKSDDVCDFAHKNTGFLPGNSFGAPLVTVDINLTPISEQQVDRPPDKRKDIRPESIKSPEMTCWYYANLRCKLPATSCKYKHYHTGVIAPAPICHHFLNGDCHFTSGRCQYQHVLPDEPQLKRRPSTITQQESKQIPVLGQDVASISHKQHNLPSPVEEQQAPSTSDLMPEMMQRAVISTPLALPPPANFPCLNMKQHIEHALKTSFDVMFSWSHNGNQRTFLDRSAFLLFHPVDHAEELELLTRWLLMHHVDISNPWFQGGWEHYTERLAHGGSGIVIVHPDFESFSELSTLGQLLRKQVRVWSLGVQLHREHNPAASDFTPNTIHDCIEIFPLGGIVYITDHVFEEQPQLALQIFKLFLAKIDDLHKATGSASAWQDVSDLNLHWRLCVRPEFMEYLFERCEEQVEALEVGEPNANARAQIYHLLSDPKLIEQDTPGQALDPRPDKFPVISERRDLAQEDPLDYFNALARSREKANLRMVRYYGGLHIDMRRAYRHFYVVHTDASGVCALQWKREIQTLTDVISPKQCLVELRRQDDGKEHNRMFDFQEKNMSNSVE
ncbi:hypothetical protein BDU57DRAFT_514657 [Ampelomyces quisqualis]|uniref:C3H1-type domain-containing protein n=1 Tax=Ampelomyces quisqualis TaxID=50730 RepID=A0A6A5QQS0_AMPQU|nr:hypothetical protein BDU57DRAFT_514657 [Ampelomyces quisqualis]